LSTLNRQLKITLHVSQQNSLMITFKSSEIALDGV
jgi:hypothetical protein